MYARPFTLLLAMLLIGCSRQSSTLSLQAIDLVQSGSDTTWKNGVDLHVTKRAGNSLEGIRFVDKDSKVLLVSATGSLSSGSIDNPRDYNCVTITLTNARTMTVESGQKAGTTAGVLTFVLSR
jgi:hypothetical protein